MSRTPRLQLSPANRDFFELVSRAAFSNPFSDHRTELDLKISECSPRTSYGERLGRVIHKVRDKVSQLESEGKADLRFYGGEDRLIMENTFLFEVFHYVFEQIDRLVIEQIESGQESRQVPFAADTLNMLTRRGFGSSEAHRYLAMFYQVRRAFFFINQGFVGQSASMKDLRLHLWNNVFTHDIRLYDRYLWNRMEDFSTLLLGETGTGKGTAAAAIGRSGFIPYDPRKGSFAESFTRNFIPINLSQFAESLIESELFGHRRGAFTGAVDHHKGIFSRCSPYGSIFLDEIGDVSVPVQVKLLQVLQDRTFSPVGSHEQLRFNGRVIAATNKSLNELRRGGIFRDDFFYRLCSDVIIVPSFRQRLQEDPKELDVMVSHVLSRMIGDASRELVQSVGQIINKVLGPHYHWPGNIRELEQCVRRILLTRNYDGDHRAVSPDLRAHLLTGIDNASLSAQEILTAYCALLHDRFGTYEEVSRRTCLDRRTVRKYIEQSRSRSKSSKNRLSAREHFEIKEERS